jgi:hypothetical protein
MPQPSTRVVFFPFARCAGRVRRVAELLVAKTTHRAQEAYWAEALANLSRMLKRRGLQGRSRCGAIPPRFLIPDPNAETPCLEGEAGPGAEGGQERECDSVAYGCVAFHYNHTVATRSASDGRGNLMWSRVVPPLISCWRRDVQRQCADSADDLTLRGWP